MRGVFTRDSAHAASRFSGMLSTKRWPSASAIMSAAAISVRSSRQACAPLHAQLTATRAQGIAGEQDTAVMACMPSQPVLRRAEVICPTRRTCTSKFMGCDCGAPRLDDAGALKLAQPLRVAGHGRALGRLRVVPRAPGRIAAHHRIRQVAEGVHAAQRHHV